MTDTALVTRKLTRILADPRRLAPVATRSIDAFLSSDTDQVIV